MIENIKEQIEKFDATGSPENLYNCAAIFYTEGKYQQAMAMIAACLQFPADEKDTLEAYKLAYNIYDAVGGQNLAAKKYYEGAISIDKRNTDVIKDYRRFFDAPLLGVAGKPESLNNYWFDSVKITSVELKNDYYLVLEKGKSPDPFSLQIAYLTGIDNNKEMIMLGKEGSSYIVSRRLVEKLGTTYDDYMLFEKATEVRQVMRCVQATLHELI